MGASRWGRGAPLATQKQMLPPPRGGSVPPKRADNRIPPLSHRCRSGGMRDDALTANLSSPGPYKKKKKQTFKDP